MRDWWIDEAAFAGPEHLDDDYVAGYDAKAQYDPTDDIERLRAEGLGDGSTVVDMGAGTGVFAVAAAALGAVVTAVDISPAMAATIRRRAEEHAVVGTISVVQAGFLSYEHVGHPVDFVFTRNALHQLPDFWKVLALRRLAAIIRPGGVLRLRDLVYDLEPGGVDAALDDWMTSAVDDPAAGYTADEFAAHVRGEFSTFTWLLEPMLDQTGFDIVDRNIGRSIYAAYTCRLRG